MMDGEGEEGVPRNASDMHSDANPDVGSSDTRGPSFSSTGPDKDDGADDADAVKDQRNDPCMDGAGGAAVAAGPLSAWRKYAVPPSKPGMAIVLESCQARAAKEQSSAVVRQMAPYDEVEVLELAEVDGNKRCRLLLEGGKEGWVSQKRKNDGVLLLAEQTTEFMSALRSWMDANEIPYKVGGLWLYRTHDYEGKDCNYNWQKITLVGYNGLNSANPGTWRAMVNHSRKLWPVAYKQNIRKAVEDTYIREGYGGYSSRDKTGHIGIRNQGATCYLNSLLQCLYHLSYFRTGVYRMDTSSDQDPKASIPLALQRLFFDLEFREDSASTTDLTASFGWQSREVFEQQDVNEMLRILCDNLSEKMDKTDPKNNAINKLYKGVQSYYTQSLDSDYRSTRSEPFYQINLVVKGNNSIYDALDENCAKEVLEGENKYCVEREGQGKSYERAERGTYFKILPPVIIIVLRRFDLDYATFRQIKINDRFEFPEELDMSKYVEPPEEAGVGGGDSMRQQSEDLPRYNTLDAGGDPDYHYTLHSVMVHMGSSPTAGHYVAYARPQVEGKWYKFNDETVTDAAAQHAIDGNYGGKDDLGTLRTQTAYCLIYVRKCVQDKICYPPREEEKPLHLRERFEREKREAEEERLREEEKNRKMLLYLVMEKDVAAVVPGLQGGLFTEHAAKELPEAQRMEVYRSAQVSDVRKQIAAVAGAKNVRLWAAEGWSKAVQQITSDSRTMEEAFGARRYGEWFVYVEVLKEGEDALKGRQGLMFLKQYEPKSDVPLSYRGHIPVTYDQKYYGGDDVRAIAQRINKVIDRDEDAPLAMWTEKVLLQSHPYESDLKYMERLGADAYNSTIGLTTSCVLVFQVPEDEKVRKFLYGGTNDTPVHLKGVENPTAVDHYKLGLSIVRVKFKPIAQDGKEVVHPLRREMHYAEVQEGAATALGLPAADAPKIRFHRPYYGKPDVVLQTKNYYKEPSKLDYMLPYGEPMLFYEVLDIPVVEMENRICMSASVSGDNCQEVQKCQLVVQQDPTIRDYLTAAISTVDYFKDCKPEELQILAIYYSRFSKMPFTVTHGQLPKPDSYDTYIIEKIPTPPPEGPQTGWHVVGCVHYRMTESYTSSWPDTHGTPFTLCIHESDRVEDVRTRMQKRLGLQPAPEGDEKAKKRRTDGSDWKISLWFNFRITALYADTTVWKQMDGLKRSSSYDTAGVPCIGFEHPPAPTASKSRQGIVIREAVSPKA
eukprot:TRINITY_DN3086_c0_g1_i1.p1 TRINITY_DN3086_c0_g1~~TRINITY_DN3086_c0_g1_i1.p1  ORF type:complete len:1267 (+),score=434.96 TRINITY_DN3086_c0_g1_i1:112-3801(+)